EYGYLPFGHVIVLEPKLGLVLSYEMEGYRVVMGLKDLHSNGDGNGDGRNGNGRNENPDENGRGDRLVA
ncbi:hypothetical protein Tco_1330360, partial [Tanacetum coccineum]